MEKDLSIIYNGKLLEVRDSLEQLKELDGFNTEKLEKAINKIEKIVEKSVEDNYSTFDNVDSKTFLHDSLATTYRQATAKLEKIKDVIDAEYQEYLKINAKYKALRNNMEKISKENVAGLSEKGRDLLSSIRNSSIVDYKMEEELVENIYALIYKLIKLELIYKGESTILEYAKTDETDCSYFAKLVKENINKLDIDSQALIRKIIINLATDGLTNDDYLDYNLLNTIIASEDDELSEIINNDFLDKIATCEELNEKYELAETKKTDLAEKLNESKTKKKQNGLRKMKKRIFLNLNAIVVATGILASGYVLKDITKTKEYKTTTTTYNSITEEEKEKETYQTAKGYSLTITEYSPWIEPGYFRDGYSRDIYKYDLSDVDKSFSNLEDYLNPQLKDELEVESETQTKDEKPKDLGYKENKYIIKEIKQNKADYNPVISPVFWGATTLGVGALIILIDWLIAFKLISKEKYSDIKDDYKTSKKKLEENNTKYLEAKQELESLISQIIHSREQVMQTYERLPEPVKEMPKIKQKIMEIEDKTNS